MIYRVVMDGNDILDFQNKETVLLSPHLDTELNAAGAFEFTMPPDHVFYNAVSPMLATIEVYEDDDLVWFGRPVEIRTDFWKQRKVYCEGALSFFNDSVQRQHEYDSISLHTFFRTVIEAHNTQVAASRQFTVGNVTVTDKNVYRMLRYESTFDVLKRQCLGAEGGYLFVRRENGVNYIDWLRDMPYSCNQPVEFGLNLLDITSGFDGSSIATCVIPLGDTVEETGEPLTVASVNDGSDTIESAAVSSYGRITRAVTFSGVRDAETLYEDGVEYLQNTQFSDLVIECSAAELHMQNENYEKFRVGQMIRCRSVPHFVDRTFPLMKLSIQLDTAAKRITLGNAARQSLTRIYKEEQTTEEDKTDTEVKSRLRSLSSKIDNLETLVQDLPGVDTTALDNLQTEFEGLSSDLTDFGDLVGGIVDGSNDGWKHWFGSAYEYSQLSFYDNHTIYFIKNSDHVEDYFIYRAGEL